MANKSGYFLKGLAGGLQSGFNMGRQIQEMQWQKAQRKKLEQKEKEIKEGIISIGNLFKQYGADGVYSDADITQIDTAFLASAAEVQAVFKGSLEHIKATNKKELEEDYQWIDLVISQIGNLDPKDVQGMFDHVEGWVKTDKAKNYITAYKNMQEKRYEAIKAQPKTELDIMGETGKKLDYAYATGNASHFNQMAKSLGVNTTFETYKKGHKEPEIPKEEPTPAPTSTENIREDILNADTFKDAKRIYDNYATKYDISDLGITDLKQEWGSGQISYLNKVKKSIENLLVDRGDKGKWLNNKPVTQEMVGIEFKGEQPASGIYAILYKSYIEYLEKLRKLGIDVSQFPELLPLSEIERVGGTEGFFAIKGVKKGDYKSIYK